jgi:hypothetical protein
MNRAFDHNGTIVATSRPTKQLRTVKKVVTIDSADRDTSKYYTNGDFVAFLPRKYQNVVSIRVMSGEFPPLYPIVVQATSPATTSGGATIHSYINGPNSVSSVWSNDTSISLTNTYYFLLEIEGLNYSDETTVGANKSTYTDSFFAKIPAIINGSFIEYNENSGQDNITRFSPALGTLDRLHIRVRTHPQQGKSGFMYWTSNGAVAAVGNRTVDFSLCLEIEMLDNGFDEYSSLETRIANTLESKIRS